MSFPNDRRRKLAMQNYRAYLESMEREACTGDPCARQRFRRTLEEDMVPIVRDTIDRGHGTTPFTQEILATAGRLARYANGCGPAERARLVHRVAACLSECMVERLGGRSPAAQAMEETVCT
jgi:hypothetical protein